jgi:hypothetical protein
LVVELVGKAREREESESKTTVEWEAEYSGCRADPALAVQEAIRQAADELSGRQTALVLRRDPRRSAGASTQRFANEQARIGEGAADDI